MQAGNNGNDRCDAVDGLLPVVYKELHAIASRSLRHERADHTLQPTALVHEAYLRLLSQEFVDWKDHGHFLAVAATTIRRILVDHARRHLAAKRRRPENRIAIEDVGISADPSHVDLIELDETLGRLAASYPRKAQIVEMRFFGGMSMDQVAKHLNLSKRTAERDWQFARAWLFRAISGGAGQGSTGDLNAA